MIHLIKLINVFFILRDVTQNYFRFYSHFKTLTILRFQLKKKQLKKLPFFLSIFSDFVCLQSYFSFKENKSYVKKKQFNQNHYIVRLTQPYLISKQVLILIVERSVQILNFKQTNENIKLVSYNCQNPKKIFTSYATTVDYDLHVYVFCMILQRHSIEKPKYVNKKIILFGIN